MAVLRWTLVVILLVIAGGFGFLVAVAAGFRRSFGASPHSPLLVALPFVAMAVLLAGLIYPASRPLLHAGAVAAAGLIAFCVWQSIRESAVITWFGVAYLVAWLAFYAMAAWPAAPAP